MDDGAANITDPSTGATWRMENYVGSGNPGPTANLATLLVVKSSLNPSDFDYMVTEFEGSEGNLVGADATTGTGLQAAERIHQLNNNNAGRASEFFYEDNGPGGKRMAINMNNPNNEGQFTLRRVTGNYVQAAGNMSLLSGDTFAYGAGANLETIYITQAASGTGAQASRLVGISIIKELADNEGQTVEFPAASGIFTDVIQEISQDNFDDSSFAATTGVVLGAAATQATGAGPFNTPWNSLFGAAPLTYDSNGAGGVQTPGGTVSGFWNAPPPYFQIVP
jgi:hypothetical protein